MSCCKMNLSSWLVCLQKCMILNPCVLGTEENQRREEVDPEGETERGYGHRMIQTWTTKMTTNSISTCCVGLL
jgi:hypothetical protein